MTCDLLTLRSARAVSTVELPSNDYTLRIYTPPIPGNLYVIGTDHAKGVVNGDLDAAVVMDLTEYRRTGIAIECAILYGNLGVSFVRPLFALMQHYNRPYWLGEQQGGGVECMRIAWDELGYRNIYTHANPNQVNPREGANPSLGWPARQNDLTITNLRMAIQDERIVLHTPELVEQLLKLQFKTRAKPGDDREPDDALRLHQPGGGSPDLCRACAYALQALRVAPVMDDAPTFRPFVPTLLTPDEPVKPATSGSIFE